MTETTRRMAEGKGALTCPSGMREKLDGSAWEEVEGLVDRRGISTERALQSFL